MVDSAKECEGLFYFDETKVSECCQIAIGGSVSIPRDIEILS